MTEQTIADVRPGTIPPWAIRVAHKDGEWLVLVDGELPGSSHGRSRQKRYAIIYGPQWGRCTCGCGRQVLERPNDGWVDLDYLTLAEAQAAFDRIEEEWLR